MSILEGEGFDALRQELALRALFGSLPPDELLTLLRQRDGTGATAVHRAVKAGDTARLAALVGADPGLLDLTDTAGRKPLELAAALLQPAAAAALADHVLAVKGADARTAAAAAALPRLLEQLPPGGTASLANLRPTLEVLLASGASLDARAVRVDGLGDQTLLCEALRWQQFGAAMVLLEAGAAAHVPEASVQPLHALAVGLLQPSGYYHYRATPQLVTPDGVLAAAQQLLERGAQLDTACTLDTASASQLRLRGRTPLAHLCASALSKRGALQQAVLSLIDLLLQAGASPHARDPGVRLRRGLGLGSAVGLGVPAAWTLPCKLTHCCSCSVSMLSEPGPTCRATHHCTWSSPAWRAAPRRRPSRRCCTACCRPVPTWQRAMALHWWPPITRRWEPCSARQAVAWWSRSLWTPPRRCWRWGPA